MIKKNLVYILAVVFFLALSYFYAYPLLEGKIVNQSDISGYVGMSHEMNAWNAAHPQDQTAWTNSMFSGMPTTTITAPSQGDWTQPVYDLLQAGKRPATYLFLTLVGGLLLMLSLGVEGLLAVGGAIAVAFCSYNFQIIQVGHNTKMQAIAYFPWVLAALIYAFRTTVDGKKKWALRTLLASSLFGLALSMQVKANHQQITYYLAIVIFVYSLVLLVYLLLKNRPALGRFFAGCALLLVFGTAGILTNSNKLIPLAKYTVHTMRGGSELTSSKSSETQSREGLDLDYATAWSYGWEELPNLMIPNFNGGSSAGEANPKWSKTYDLLVKAGQPNAKQVVKQLPMYWGPQPFTAGPMYLGAITVFLFILGLMVVKGTDKWWIVISSIIAIFLGLGSHFMGFTKFWYDYMPLYNKFRTVSMALTVLQVTFPALGFLALSQVLRSEDKQVNRKLWKAYAISGGFCLLFALVPSLAGSFTGAVDSGQPDVLVEAFQADRRHLLVTDAFTSLLFITLAFLLIRFRRREAALGVGVLVLISMFSAGKRYLNADHFTSPRSFNNQFEAREVDKLILEDTDPSYRVADLTVNIFNDSHPSYWHKNIGGYSPAKLQRYQDLIDRYLARELNSVYAAAKEGSTIDEIEDNLPNLPVLSALNTRYFILGAGFEPVRNKYARGNAWFIDNLVHTSSADEEIASVGQVDLGKTAVIGPDFKEFTVPEAGAPGDTIVMTSYAPNELRYRYSLSSQRGVVFSEVYYPDGWTLSVDGQEFPLVRADWILRAAVLPAGEHEAVMRFDPQSYRFSGNLSRASSILILLNVAGAVAGLFLTRKKEDEA